MIDDATRAEVRRLFFAEHWKVGTIAAQHGLHHGTVKAALGLVDPPKTKGTSRPTKIDAYVPFVRDTLARYPSLVATRVADMVRERGYDGTDASVRRCIRHLGLRPKPVREAYFRLTTLPGEQGQVDWAHFGRVPVEGGQRGLYCFVMTLSWSRATYAEFFLDQTLQSFVTGFVHAVAAFGGTPRAVLTDNLKSVVLERQGDAIRFHPRILEMCGEYLTMMRPCAPRRGNEKGRVERRILPPPYWVSRRMTELTSPPTPLRRRHTASSNAFRPRVGCVYLKKVAGSAYSGSAVPQTTRDRSAANSSSRTRPSATSLRGTQRSKIDFMLGSSSSSGAARRKTSAKVRRGKGAPAGHFPFPPRPVFVPRTMDLWRGVSRPW